MRATTFPLADSMRRLGTESAFVVLARAKALEAQGRSIIHLEIGEPDFNTPEHIKDAAIRSLRANRTHYTPAAGIMELRTAIAEYVERTRGVQVSTDQIVVTPGAAPVVNVQTGPCVVPPAFFASTRHEYCVLYASALCGVYDVEVTPAAVGVDGRDVPR